MSQEQPPVRSRRELRRARDEKQANGSTGPGQVSPASKQSAASPSADPAQAQRSSQIRARDRAALRAIKELEEKEGQLAAGGPPTRRQLRLQQLKEQAVTSANPVVPPAPAEAAKRPGAQTPQPSAPHPAPPAPAAAKAAATSATARTAPATADGPRLPDGMSVEQALATRSLIAEQAKNQLAKMEHIASLDPEAVDPDGLAEQIALAERAAVLNRRAMAKQKLAEQAAPPAAANTPRSAPSAASNLAMVTPLEFVQVPGIDRPVMKPPATSYVPLVTNPGPKVPASPGKGRPSGTPQEAGDAPASGRSRVIARAEAAAKAASRPKPVTFSPAAAGGQSEDLFDDLPRIPASSAYGLEPLDAATAGLARAKRMRVIQFCVLAFGIVALISGVMLIISGITR